MISGTTPCAWRKPRTCLDRKTNNRVRRIHPVTELDALTGMRSIWQRAVRLLTARWRLMPLPVEVRGWTPGSGANFGKIKFPALSALASFRLLGAASRPSPFSANFPIQMLDASVWYLSQHCDQDFLRVARSVGCRVSRVASLPSTPDTDTRGLKPDTSGG